MLHNTKDACDERIIMKGSAKGPHRLPKNKRGDLLHEWKGRILKFKLGKKGWLAKVQHVYMAKDMLLPPSTNKDRYLCIVSLFFVSLIFYLFHIHFGWLVFP